MEDELDLWDEDTVQMESEPSPDESTSVNIQQTSKRIIEYCEHSLDALEVGSDNPDE